MASIAPIKPLLPVGEQRVVFRNITWPGYQQLLKVFGDRRAARITFDRGILEITMPLEEHEFSGRSMGIPEFWRYNGQEWYIYQLQADGYVEALVSPTFPMLSKEKFYEFLAVARINEVQAEIDLRRWISEII